MHASRLPPGGENLFQAIKTAKKAAEAKGLELIDLSIGQPEGTPLLSVRRGIATACWSEDQAMWEYQDNGSPGAPDFAQRFVQAQVGRDLFGFDVAYLPIPGIKPILEMIPRACGGIEGKKLLVVTMTKPGYPTPKVQARYQGHDVWEPELSSWKEFRFGLGDLPEKADVIMCNYPHNPSGQVATHDWWAELCHYCERRGTRLFNDAAYAALTYSSEAKTLSEVAVDFPELSWAEAFSASKLVGNGTGLRVGALVGSPDFVADIEIIKGNSDSGFCAPVAAGVLEAIEKDQEGIGACRDKYLLRIGQITGVLGAGGLKIALLPAGGFFILNHVPKSAFGERIDEDAALFNRLAIANIGLVGVPFGDLIRYAVCTDPMPYREAIIAGLQKAALRY